MEPWMQMAITIVAAVFASSGFWAFLQSRRDKKEAKKQKNDPASRMLLGLGHDRIIYLCIHYIERGWISSDEYSDLKKYLYEPYKAMGGNGGAERLMKDIEKLPVKSVTYLQQAKQGNPET